mgnify:CR=1 FL=1
MSSVVAAQVVEVYSEAQNVIRPDIIMMIRMAGNKEDNLNGTITTTTKVQRRVHPDQERWMKKAGVRLAYLPSLKRDNFATSTLEKIRVLELTEYERVLFMDGDAIPACPLNYFFEKSMNGEIEPYVGVSGAAAPITAAAFMVTPQKGLFQAVMNIYHNRPNRTKFDAEWGWGWVHDEKDMWQSWWWKNRLWTFKGVGLDQGLLYMFLKYVLKNHTLVTNKKIEQWREIKVNSTYWKEHTLGKDIFNPPNGTYISKVSS